MKVYKSKESWNKVDKILGENHFNKVLLEILINFSNYNKEFSTRYKK